MNPFVYQANPARVVFGAGAFAQLPAEIDRLGCRRALFLSTPNQIDLAHDAADLLGDTAAGIFDQAQMHVPAGIAAQASKAAKDTGADCLVATGGGSTIGLAKAIALDTGLPVVAVPTTYAGSEMTPIYGITDEGRKRTGSDPRVLPRTVIYDPELTRGLPVGISVTSGINAIAHAAEALYARDGNPIMETFAELGIRALARAIPAIRSDAADMQARSDALYGAWLCGTTLGHVGMALHHKLCHTSAAPSTCPMPRPTPSCCRMRSPTTARARPGRCRSSGERSMRKTVRARSLNSRGTMARQPRFATSASGSRTFR